MEPNKPDTRQIIERLEKLERQNRGLKQATAVALLILSSLVLMAQTSAQKVVEANAFFLVDQNGNRRAELSMTQGAPGLIIYGTGKGRVSLVAGKGGSGLSLEEPGGKASALLNVVAGASLSLTDDKGSMRLNVHKANPSLYLAGLDGTASLNVVGPSAPYLSLDGSDGQQAFLNHSGLMINGGANGMATLVAAKQGGPALAITDSEGFRSVLGVTKTVVKSTGEQRQTSAAALTMFDKGGTVTWQAP
jgi:hypothetical protein